MKKLFLGSLVLAASLIFSSQVYADYMDDNMPKMEEFSKKLKSKGVSDKGIKAIEEELSKSFSKEMVMKAKEDRMKLKEELYSILTAAKFEEAKYRAVSEKIATLNMERMKKFHDSMIKALSKLDQKDRQIIADMMEKGPKGKKANK
jgi:hypothetical protein